MSEEQDSTATTEVTADQAETQESQANSEAGESQDAPKEQSSTGFDLVVPEGYSMDDSATKEFSEFAQELGVDKEKAQKMLDRHVTSLNDSMGRSDKAMKEVHDSWATESMNDKEFGGTNLAENIVGARKVMNSFSSPASDADGKPVVHQEGAMKGQQMTKVEVLLNQTGMGNHPEMIRVFHRISKAVSEDSFVPGDMKPKEQKKTHADIMYGGTHPS
jgi:hypothetical protein|tara:strand:- start:309 stop:962 length:654 start_codon:yes stop_codon:yes gene_type:complete